MTHRGCLPGLLMLPAFLILTVPAHAVDVDDRIKLSLVGVADRGRDLGLEDNVSPTREGYLDATPWLHLQFTPNWAAFARVRLFAPSGALLPPGNDNNNVGASDQVFVGLNEAWVEYAGLSSYPNESLRLGRQRIRGDDAQFIDQDIDALRWIFDTTLLDAEFGVARQFSSYRSDGIEVPPQQRDRSYVFGDVAYDWMAEQRLGLRVMYADDNNHLRPEGADFDPTQRDTRVRQAWIGAFADSHAYDWQLAQRGTQRLAYWSSATWLVGSRERAPDDGGIVAPHVDENVQAWTAEAGGRLRLLGPLQLGAAYSYSSGGNPGDTGTQYEQSGIQSNYSRFTGTRALIYRYNEAYRPELGNLQAATAFLSAVAGDYDASLVYNRFQRPHRAGPVRSDALRVAPVQDSHDLGQGIDLVLSRYFSLHQALAAEPAYAQDDDSSSVIRLRGSVFDPGAAYGSDAHLEYRVMVELTLWY